MDAQELLQATTTHSLPGLEVCMSRDELLLALGGKTGDAGKEDLALFMPWCHTEKKGSMVIWETTCSV